MKSFLIVVSSPSTAPTLYHKFTMASEAMAISYAKKLSIQITCDKYNQFTLFETSEESQHHILDWAVETFRQIEIKENVA